MKAAPRGIGLGASLALHGLVAALLILWPVAEEFSADQAEAQGIAVFYEGAPDIGDVESPAAPPEVAPVKTTEECSVKIEARCRKFHCCNGAGAEKSWDRDK